MGLCNLTIEELRKHLPGTILSFGHPDRIQEVDLSNCELTALDLFQHHGPEVIMDLSKPLPAAFPLFDIVLDCGTTEHVANPAQAFLNAANALKIGGVVIHHLPISDVNHGYWNINPCWYRDFYHHNGFRIERLDLTEQLRGGENRRHDWPAGGAYGEMPTGRIFLALVVARRLSSQNAQLPLCQPQWIK